MSSGKNIVYNLTGAIAPIALSLVAIPLYIGSIGEARYGVLAVTWLLLGYFSLFDLGLGRATAQRIAALGDTSSDRLAETFWTALAINVVFGIIGGLLIWPVADYFFSHHFSVGAALQPELEATIPWLVLAVPLATFSGVLTGALQGREKFFDLNAISILGTFLTQLLPLLVVWLYGPQLQWLLPTVIFTKLITLGFLFARCRTHVFRHHPPRFSRQHARGLVKFGGWVTVSSMVGPIMIILDRFVIGALMGARTLTYYTVPFQLAERTNIVASATTSALFPRFAGLDVEKARKLATTAISTIVVIMTAPMLIAVLGAEPFLRWWLSAEFSLYAGLPAKILLLGFWINAIAHVPFALLQAMGKPDLVAKCHLAEVIPYLVMLFVSMHYWGLPGVAIAFSLRTLLDLWLLSWFSGIYKTCVIALRVPVIILLTGFVIAGVVETGSLVWWITATCLLILSVIWSWQSAPSALRNFLFDVLTRSFWRSNGDSIEK